LFDQSPFQRVLDQIFRGTVVSGQRTCITAQAGNVLHGPDCKGFDWLIQLTLSPEHGAMQTYSALPAVRDFTRRRRKTGTATLFRTAPTITRDEITKDQIHQHHHQIDAITPEIR
jgi:hypothetical protein